MAVPDMLVYSIKIQWVLVWFPIARGAQIDRPFFNVGTFAYRSSDPTFEVTGPQFLLTEPDAERLEGVQATMDVDVDDDALFSIRLTACIGLAKERTTIKAKPDFSYPVHAQRQGSRWGALPRNCRNRAWNDHDRKAPGGPRRRVRHDRKAPGGPRRGVQALGALGPRASDVESRGCKSFGMDCLSAPMPLTAFLCKLATE